MGILMSVMTNSGAYSSIILRAACPFMAVPHTSMPNSSQFIMDLMPICTSGSSSAISILIMSYPLRYHIRQGDYHGGVFIHYTFYTDSVFRSEAVFDPFIYIINAHLFKEISAG